VGRGISKVFLRELQARLEYLVGVYEKQVEHRTIVKESLEKLLKETEEQRVEKIAL
jgi:hypothetical protein